MDAVLWRQHLELAEKHVALGERIVVAQRAIVAELIRGGHPVRMARRILKAYEDLLELHREDRDRLKRELADRKSRVTAPRIPSRLRRPARPS